MIALGIRGPRHWGSSLTLLAIRENIWESRNRRMCSWPNAWNIQPHFVECALRTKIQRLSVIVPPRHIVWMLGRDHRPQVFSFGRNDPQTARPGNVEVA